MIHLHSLRSCNAKHPARHCRKYCLCVANLPQYHPSNTQVSPWYHPSSLQRTPLEGRVYPGVGPLERESLESLESGRLEGLGIEMGHKEESLLWPSCVMSSSNSTTSSILGRRSGIRSMHATASCIICAISSIVALRFFRSGSSATATQSSLWMDITHLGRSMQASFGLAAACVGSLPVISSNINCTPQPYQTSLRDIATSQAEYQAGIITWVPWN